MTIFFSWQYSRQEEAQKFSDPEWPFCPLIRNTIYRAPVEGVWYPNIPISKICYPPIESPSWWINIPTSQYPNFNKLNIPISLFYRLISQYPSFSDQYPPIFSDIPISRFGLPGPYFHPPQSQNCVLGINPTSPDSKVG